MRGGSIIAAEMEMRRRWKWYCCSAGLEVPEFREDAEEMKAHYEQDDPKPPIARFAGMAGNQEPRIVEHAGDT